MTKKTKSPQKQKLNYKLPWRRYLLPEFSERKRIEMRVRKIALGMRGSGDGPLCSV